MGQNEANELPKRKTMRLKGLIIPLRGPNSSPSVPMRRPVSLATFTTRKCASMNLAAWPMQSGTKFPCTIRRYKLTPGWSCPTMFTALSSSKARVSQSVEIVPHPCRPAPVGHSLGRVVGAYKGAVTQRIRRIGGECRNPVWQRNYYDHIVRDEDELCRIRQYIADNPLCWDEDHDNPLNQSYAGGVREAGISSCRGSACRGSACGARPGRPLRRELGGFATLDAPQIFAFDEIESGLDDFSLHACLITKHKPIVIFGSYRDHRGSPSPFGSPECAKLLQ